MFLLTWVFLFSANIPKPVHLIARFLVQCGWPQNGRNRGIHILNLMKGLSPNLHENIVDLWDTIIPKLVEYLDGKGFLFN